MQYREYNIEGRTAVITGASSGVGRETAVLLAGCGAKVVAIARSQQKLDDLVSQISGEGGEITAYACDVADEVSITGIAKEVVSKYGKIDILINDAGVEVERQPGLMGGDLLVNTSLEQYRRVLATNLIGQYNCMCACLPSMLEQQYGRIVNVSSVTGLNGDVGSAAYVASKAGIFAQTKAFAKNFGRNNILFNTVAPGMVDTPMHSLTPPEAFQETAAMTPIGRVAQPIDIARVILFFAQEHLFMTGQVIAVDGGLNMP